MTLDGDRPNFLPILFATAADVATVPPAAAAAVPERWSFAASLAAATRAAKSGLACANPAQLLILDRIMELPALSAVGGALVPATVSARGPVP